ncbi:MAG: hypothetical protein JNK45_25455 [Myxococcales bacterium]|nr:hypothetical protein [Myxococcales bacterium]
MTTTTPPAFEGRRADDAPAAVHPWAFAGLAVALAATLVLHFVATAISVFPPNPASAAHTASVHGYLAPYFVQSWRLFAPDPGGPSFVLLVQCRGTDGATTPWIDVTTPMFESTRANRLHPAQALHRLNKGAIGHMLGIRDAFTEHLEAKLAADPDNTALREVVEAVTRRDDASAEARSRPLMRLASAYCGGILGPDALDGVRPRIDVFEIPPFSRRHDAIDPSQVRTYEYPWRAAESIPPL